MQAEMKMALMEVMYPSGEKTSHTILYKAENTFQEYLSRITEAVMTHQSVSLLTATGCIVLFTDAIAAVEFKELTQ